MDLQDEAECRWINTEAQGSTLAKDILNYQPQGFIAKGSEEKVLRLKKALYGLNKRQACTQQNKILHGSRISEESERAYSLHKEPRNIHMGFQEKATVAQSSAEAEYIAAAATSNHAIWLRRILEDMGEKQEEPTTIYCDNKSAIDITKNLVQHNRTKHIDIKYHSLREATTRGGIELKYCSTEKQLADIFTKALPRNKFEELRMKIGVCHKHIKGEY
ncbi:UNVERIFIED_CONTAM: Retrovirus-related Pol polyprotein from transposon TNT 1-94 [Sesamum calycinum]|uniref:Retrovirus-related Pol polyprotein from transposon TNT 1-94 n=1 Tax=Sesamum calycinum TaxID=2727403 RepID=A0AAW2R6K1_9LAMI